MTVSIAADSSGMLSVIERVRRVYEGDVAGNDEGVGGNEQDVVERQRLADDTHQTLLCAKMDYTLQQSLARHALNSAGPAKRLRRDVRARRRDADKRTGVSMLPTSRRVPRSCVVYDDSRSSRVRMAVDRPRRDGRRSSGSRSREGVVR